MSRVITFSRVFPSYHPRKGESTMFVEKVWSSLCQIEPDVLINEIYQDGFDRERANIEILPIEPKHHTIRAGNRWKVGDKFSPRVWSGKPYNSKQITIAPDIQIKKVWEFECKEDGVFYLNGKSIDVTSCDLPMNDGLSSDDLLEWFPVGKPFKGQIICWSDSITY